MDFWSRSFNRLLAAWHERALVLKALSFGMIGVFNTLVDATVFFLALATVTSSLVAANTMSWLVAVSGSYVMNSFITFARESGRQLRWRAYLTFLVSGLAGLVGNTAMLVLVAQVLLLPIWFAKLCAIGVSFLLNFSLSHLVVFRNSPRSNP